MRNNTCLLATFGAVETRKALTARSDAELIVMVREREPGDPQLAACVEGETTPEKLRLGLRERMPEFMVIRPSSVTMTSRPVLMEAMPPERSSYSMRLRRVGTGGGPVTMVL